MKISKAFISAILAGMCIAFGGTVFLSVENKVIGAALFTLGLFVVCTQGFNLFTGKACYVFDNDKTYALNLITIWLGNLAGTGIIAGAVRLTRIAGISQRAADMCAQKASDTLPSLFVLGIFCNIFIYIAVEGYKSNPHEIGRYLALFFGVMGFILCGTEHCVADMFYFWVAAAWSTRTIVCLLVISAGNLVGSVVFPLLKKLI